MFLLLFFLTSCDKTAQQPWLIQGQSMGTSYHIRLFPVAAQPEIAPVQAKIQAKLDEMERIFSTYRADSELSRFNQAPPGQAVELHPQLILVMQRALQISAQSGGAFDMTVGALVDLWGFGPGKESAQEPSAEEILSRQAETGYTKIVIQQNQALRQSGQARVDLSAIAKGYAVDQVLELLASLGFKSVMVEVGGELRTLGSKPDGSPWHIAIEKPVEEQGQVQLVFQLNNLALATSGDYRNYREINGQRFSHSIDPTSGRPIRHRLASVSVLDQDCMSADGWATALMVLGEEKGLALANQLGLKAYFIQRQDQGFAVSMSQGFQEYIKTHEVK